MSSAWLTQECRSADNAAPRTTADVHEGVARGDRPADQFQRPAPHRRGEAISHLAFRAGIQDTVFLVHLFCLHPLRGREFFAAQIQFPFGLSANGSRIPRRKTLSLRAV